LNDHALLTKSVFDEIRHAIISGEFRPGERLIEAELAVNFKASRTPIRESLQRLSAAGLVQSRRRGWVVHAFTQAEIRQIYEVRMALEGYACRLAARNRNPDAVANLSRFASAYNAAVQSGDLLGSSTSNDLLHNAINEMAGNPKLSALNVDAREHYFTARLGGLFQATELAESHRGHLAIVAAIEAGNEDQAEAAVRDHLAVTMQIAIKHQV
jgi:DNA-binding GntR family transcriptional regulator